MVRIYNPEIITLGFIMADNDADTKAQNVEGGFLTFVPIGIGR